MNQQLTLEQIEQLNQVSDPVARRRFSVLFQLPQDLQVAFESEQTTNSLWDITKVKYNLADSDISKVSRIIGLIFLGELPIKNFITELKNKLNVDIQKAQAIAQDINQAIFQPVRVSLMEVHGINDANQRMDTNDTNKYANTNTNQPRSNQQINSNQYQQAQPPYAKGYGVAQQPRPPQSTQYQAPPRQQPVKLTPPAYQPNYEDAQKRRDEVLNKIRQQQQPPPSTAKPASYYFPRKVRPIKKSKNIDKYNSFFS